MQSYNPEEWYTPPQALERLSRNSSNKKIDESYLRKLAKAGRVERLKIAEKYSLYKKTDIDGYIVESRGQKAGRAMKQRKKDTATNAQ